MKAPFRGPRAPPGQRGIVLIAVLWVAILLALLSGMVMKVSRSDLNLARNLRQQAQAELAADSALQTAIYVIVNDGTGAWHMDGTVYAWRIGDTEVRVRMADENARIDLNAANPLVLASLFRAAGMEASQATALSGEIAAYRNQGNGGDASQGVARLRNSRRKPFVAVEALYRLPGMSAELFRRVAPALTVYTGRPWPSAKVLSPLVLAATQERVLEGASADGSTGQLLPPAQDLETLKESPAALSAGQGQPDAVNSYTFRIDAEALTSNGSYFAREAVVTLNGSSGAPWQFLMRRRGERRLFPTSGMPR